MASVQIWDALGIPEHSADHIVLWRHLGETGVQEQVSIPGLVDANEDDLRRRYLALVYDLAHTVIDDTTIADHLEIRPGLSYWWMTLIAEKSNFLNSPEIEDAIRFLAFLDWAADREIRQIKVVSSKQPLIAAFKAWCRIENIDLTLESLGEQCVSQPMRGLRRFYEALPIRLQALIWFVLHLKDRWCLRGIGRQAWRDSPNDITFVSYSANLDPQSLKEGEYESRYWGGLGRALAEEGSQTNWLSIYVKDSVIPNARSAARVFGKLAQNPDRHGVHATLDSFLSFGLVLRVLKEYWQVSRKGRHLCEQLERDQHKTRFLWPFLEIDWKQSFFGQAALSRLLFHAQLEAAMDLLPTQRIGSYLQENQGWEFAFVHQWKSKGHGKLIGHPHTTMRYWDLRYFHDKRAYLREGRNVLPLPDAFAANGPVSREEMLRGGVPQRMIVDVEALRYLHLVSISSESPKASVLRLLVVGDFHPRDVARQFQLLGDALRISAVQIEVVAKPHPMCPFTENDYPLVSMDVTMQSIDRLLPDSDVVFASCKTSASVDAYCWGLSVISDRDPAALNHSPLKNVPGICFISDGEALAAALDRVAEHAENRERSDMEYFYLNRDLVRWRRLLLATEHTSVQPSVTECESA